MNAVAPGFRAHINHRIARAARLGEKQIFFFCDAQRQYVDEWIRRIAWLELHFAANRRHAKTVAVMRDAAYDSVENPPVARDGSFVDAFRG